MSMVPLWGEGSVRIADIAARMVQRAIRVPQQVTDDWSLIDSWQTPDT